MNRARFFGVLLAFAVVALAFVLLWYLVGFQSGKGSISGMMGQMMGGQYGGVAMPGYVWGGVASILVLIAVAAGGLAYYSAVPEIKTVAASDTERAPRQTAKAVPSEDWGVLIRTSKPDERKVLEVLASHDGKYLQKYIVKESGLSRLKTHRVISRLAERGVVTAAPSGNTNEISLAPWIARPAAPGS